MQHADYQNNRDLYRRLLINSVLGVICILFFILVFPQIISMLLPFVIAFIMAAILNPLVNKITGTGKISRRLIAAILSVTVFLLVFFLAGLIVYTIGQEIVSLATYIQQNWGEIISGLNNMEKNITEIANFFPIQAKELLGGLEDNITTFLKNASENVLNMVITSTTTITTKAGSILINFVIAVLSAYFIIAEYNGIIAGIKKRIGNRASVIITLLKESVVSALGRYVKAQLMLALFAFLFMFIALFIYRQPYALLIALFLGLIDLLPIVGTIAVLVPWGIFEWIGGNMSKGLFLVILGILFFLVRKVVEPKIVGTQTGLHPLAALISIYIGLKLSGIWGAIIGPVILMLIISIVKSGIFDSTISDIKAVAGNISRVINNGRERQQEQN